MSVSSPLHLAATDIDYPSRLLVDYTLKARCFSRFLGFQVQLRHAQAVLHVYQGRSIGLAMLTGINARTEVDATYARTLSTDQLIR